jgi:antitoxin component YwqK of YwqJK toxin-antitoxin module
MKENQKIKKYQSGNVQTETYKDGDTQVTKHFYNGKNAYVKELIYLKDGVTTIKHNTTEGIASKLENFVDGKRHGLETRYFNSKNGKIKSTKSYENGKLHGEKITYNELGEVIKREMFADGKLIK